MSVIDFREIHHVVMLFVALLDKPQQLLFTLGLDESPHEDVGDGHAESDEENGERGLDSLVEGKGELTDDSVHLNETEE